MRRRRLVSQSRMALLTAWLVDYNHERPHGSLGQLTPCEFAEQARKHGTKRVQEGEILKV